MLQRKLGAGIVQLKSTVSTNDGETVTLVEAYTGPYILLSAKQTAEQLTAKSTHLVPTAAGEGLLSVTRESLTGGTATLPSVVTTEVIWNELRKPVEEAPFFSVTAGGRDRLWAAEIAHVKKMVEENAAAAYGSFPSAKQAGMYKLHELLAAGTTEWVTGVPLVRRTTTNKPVSLTTGNAWYRDTPPVVPAGTWEFLKTADDRIREGKSTSQVEEWTGATVWDADLYP